MRDLASPAVLKAAVLAGCGSSLACFPRLRTHDRYPLWYLEAVMFLGSVMLWGFVFAWHAKYMKQPVFREFQVKLWSVVTLLGLSGAALLRASLDPVLRPTIPSDYPHNFEQWVSMTLFSLAFTQLFLLFAPIAWVARLSKSRPFAIVFTILFGVFVLLIKERTSPTQLSPLLFAALASVRFLNGMVSVLLYLRGGVALVLWWTLLLQCRHLWMGIDFG